MLSFLLVELSTSELLAGNCDATVVAVPYKDRPFNRTNVELSIFAIINHDL